MYCVDRELHQPVEETLRGLPITKIGDWDDFARTHPFAYNNINVQNFSQFLTLYQQFIDQVAPVYWREVKQENVPVEERKPVIALLWGDSQQNNRVDPSRGNASLMKYLSQEFSLSIKFFHTQLFDDGVYPSQKTLLVRSFENLRGTPAIFLYGCSKSGELTLSEQTDGGFSTVELIFRNRQVFKEYITKSLLQ